METFSNLFQNAIRILHKHSDIFLNITFKDILLVYILNVMISKIN